VAITVAGTLRDYRREAEAALEMAQSEIALAEENGFREREATARALRGWAMSELGHAEQGISELEPVAASAPSVFQMRALEMLARVSTQSSRSDRALATLDRALARTAHSGAHRSEPELYRLKAETLLAGDPSARLPSRRTVFARPSKLPEVNRQSGGSFGLRIALHVYCATQIAAMKDAPC
jgi:hypothetical protein